MKLPIALKTALDESERHFSETLARLGLTREKLNDVAGRIREKQSATKPGRVASASPAGRRIYNV